MFPLPIAIIHFSKSTLHRNMAGHIASVCRNTADYPRAISFCKSTRFSRWHAASFAGRIASVCRNTADYPRAISFCKSTRFSRWHAASFNVSVSSKLKVV